MEKMITDLKLVGLTGTNGAGKGEAAAFFMRNGFQYYSLSDVIREKLQQEKMPVTRDNLILTGNSMREQGGSDILARLVLQKVSGPTVIDSIRNPFEIEFFRQQKDFTLLAIDAPIEVRYDRIMARGRNESISSLQEFKDKEAEENTSLEKGQQLQNCIKMADYMILNNSSLEDLYCQLEQFL